MLLGYNAPIMTMCLDFFNNYKIGVDFALKVLNWNDDTLIRLQLWDIAGNLNQNNLNCFPL